MAALKLASLADCAAFGGLLAKLLLENGNPPLLLDGPLGCGKTALTAAICANFPDSQKCEVSSPSFTICNLYPSAPPILHCDLYRCGASLPDEIYEFIETGAGQLIMEWASEWPERPENYLDISFKVKDNIRLLEIKGKGGTFATIALALELEWAGKAKKDARINT